MATLEGSPSAKRRCTSRKGDEMQAIEENIRVREHQLPQQFPSVMQQTVKIAIRNEREGERRVNIKNFPTSALIIPGIPEMPSTERSAPFKLQKLRILSPDGRDLGEFNLQLRPDTPLKRHKIVISKSRNLKPAEEKVAICHPPRTSSKIFPQTPKQDIAKKSDSISRNKIICDKTFETNKTKPLQQQKEHISQTRGMLMHNRDEEASKQVVCSNNVNELSASASGAKSLLKYQTADKNTLNTVNVINNVKSSLAIQEVTTENKKSFPDTNVSVSGNCDSSLLSANAKTVDKKCSSNNYLSFAAHSKGKCIATIKSTGHGKIVTSLQAVNPAQSLKKIKKKCNADRSDTNSEDDLNCQRVSSDKSNFLQDKSDAASKTDQVRERKLQRNIMTVIPDKKHSLLKSNILLTQECNKTASSASDKSAANVNHSKIRCSATSDNIQSKHASKKTYENSNGSLEGALHNSVTKQYISNLQKVHADVNYQQQLKKEAVKRRKEKYIAVMKDVGHSKTVTSSTTENRVQSCANESNKTRNANGLDVNSKSNLNYLGVSSNRTNLLAHKPDHVSKGNRMHETKHQENVVLPNNENLPKALPDKDVLDRYNIIKKAIDSVQARNLRELALQSLADCKIGIERYVLIQSPQKYKTVHDTQAQTTVFGLLDKQKSFLSINKDIEGIHRINHITLHDVPDDHDWLKSQAHNVHAQDNLAPTELDTIEQESDFNIDNFLAHYCEENSNLNMKATLSTTMRCRKIIDQLEKDFECATHHDQEGRLSIHNAVLSDNIRLVQRQLMFLKLRKESTDVLTLDGQVTLS